MTTKNLTLEKPKTVSYDFNAIHPEFKKFTNWVLWKYEHVNDRWTKVPYQASGSRANSTDSKTWCTFDEADTAFLCGDFDGIGFAIGDSGLTCIDVDHISDWDFVEPLKPIEGLGYFELSPSGDGLHLWVKAQKPNNKCKSKNFYDSKIEIYNADRFITMTGSEAKGEFLPCQDEFNTAFKELFFPKGNLEAEINKEWSQVAALSMDDTQIIDRIMSENSNGRNDWITYHNFGLPNGADASACDQAYVNKVAFYTKDHAQIERIWLNSGLGKRKKTQERKDYRDRTIAKAMDVANYQPSSTTKTPISSDVVNKVEARESDPFGLDEIDITKPHGILGNMCQAMDKSAHRKLPESYPLYGLQTLAMVAMVAGIRSFTGSKLNLITLLIAPTASGKENGQAFFDNVADQLKLSKYTFNKPRSDKDLITNMVETEGMCSYGIDEAHGLFEAMNNKNAQSYQVAMGAEMLTMATKGNYVLSGNHRRDFRTQYEVKLSRLEAQLEKLTGEDQETIKKKRNFENKIEFYKRVLDSIENGFKNPLINMAMASTPEKIDRVVSSETIESGLMGRSLVIRADEERKELNLYPSGFLCDQAILWDLNSALSNQNGNVQITEDAKELYEKVVLHYDRTMRNHDTLGGLYARMGDRAITIASLLAVVSGKITIDDMKYAFALCLRHIEDCRFLLVKANAVETGDYDEKLLEVKERVLKFCPKIGISKSALKQKVCKPKDIAKMNKRAELSGVKTIYSNAINQLLEDKMIALKDDRFVRL